MVNKKRSRNRKRRQTKGVQNMSMVVILTALLTGWAIRKKAEEVWRIRRVNNQHRKTLGKEREEHRKELHREESWRQLRAIQWEESALSCR